MTTTTVRSLVRRILRPGICVLFLLVLVGCESFGIPATSRRPASSVTSLSPADPLSLLVGEFDDNAQIWRLQNQPPPAAGKNVAVKEISPLRVHHLLRLLEHKDADSALLLWQLEVVGAAQPTAATWLFRVSIDTNGITLLPYRAIDPAAISARLGDSAKRFELQPNEWAELDACALHGTLQSGHLIATVNQAACSGLLPSLGASAVLLPLRIDADAELLRVATFADQARGPTAIEEAHRVRWFGGYAAINGAGPRATMESKDWHEQRNLRIHDEGGRLPLLWRDGSRSGYSFELARQSVGGQSQVLKLALIEEASGRTLSYVWANPEATRIGMHLGWVQVGLELETAPVAAH